MQKCNSCGADLPENARFCGECGSTQGAGAANATTRSTSPRLQPPGPEENTLLATQPPSSDYPTLISAPSWPSNAQAPGTPLPLPAAENEDERRRDIPPWPLFYDAAVLGGNALPGNTPGTPGVQGTPQIGSVPGVPGSPTLSPNPPVSHPGQAPPPTHHILHGHHLTTRILKTAGSLSAKTTLLVITAVVVVAAGGIAAVNILSRPQPLISITSNYHVGNIPAGTNGTRLHINGQKFSGNSAITFLLDGHAVPGNSGTRSDSSGAFSADMTITNVWNVGTHTLTARDASNYSPKNSSRVTIVPQGQANTPGPDGAPPDDASFQIIAQIQGGQATETEIVTGHPDPRGGTVCQAEDNGQPVVTTGVTTGAAALPVKKTSTFSCAGTYKGGILSFTETVMTDVHVFSLPDGTTTTCTLKSPQPDERLSGSYTGNNTFSGTITYPTIPDSNYSCQGDGSYTFYNFYRGNQVNWTGQVTNEHQ